MRALERNLGSKEKEIGGIVLHDHGEGYQQPTGQGWD